MLIFYQILDASCRFLAYRAGEEEVNEDPALELEDHLRSRFESLDHDVEKMLMKGGVEKTKSQLLKGQFRKDLQL
jgi:hypothetical protein